MPPATDPIARIRARGVAALPLLAALAADTYWTPLVTAGARMGGISLYGYARGYYSGSGAPDDASTDAVYHALPRPLTRGQIATEMLAAALPGDNGGDNWQAWMPDADKLEAQRARAQRLAAAARAWQAETAGKTLLQVAELYLQKGSDDQRQQAAEYLLDGGGEAAYPAIEAAILNAGQEENPSFLMWMVETYLRQRGPAAKGFADKLGTLLGAPAPAAAAPAEGAATGLFVAGGQDRAAWAAHMLPWLQRFVSPQPLNEVLAEAKELE